MKTIQQAKIQLFFELSVFFVKKKLRHSSGVCPVHGRAGSGGGIGMPGRQSVWPAHRRGGMWGRAAAAQFCLEREAKRRSSAPELPLFPAARPVTGGGKCLAVRAVCFFFMIVCLYQKKYVSLLPNRSVN